MIPTAKKTQLQTPLNTAPPGLIKSVVFDAKVVMSIIQSDFLKVSEDGLLFGIVVDDVLEITNCVPLPPEKIMDAEDDRQREQNARNHLEERRKFQERIADQFRKNNLDSEIAGWYTISWPDSPYSKGIIDTHLCFQTDSSINSIVVSYDPWRSLSGSLHLKVLRLTPEYRALVKGGNLTQKGMTEARMTCGKPIYEELPFSVNTSLLTKVFLYETNFLHQGARDGNSVMGERELSVYMKRSMAGISSDLDDLARELGECTTKTRKKAKDVEKAEGNARHNSLLLSRGLVEQCKHVSEVAGEVAQSALVARLAFEKRP